MSNEAKALADYKLQLQQVEAALTVDPSNEELGKLRNDLQEVIELTQELLAQQAVPAVAGTSSTEGGSNEPPTSGTRNINPEHMPLVHNWKAGDRCQAIWSEDQGYYEAVVEEILDDGSCSVTFAGYGDTDVSQVSLLKPSELNEDGTDYGPEGTQRPKTKKDLLAAQREYKRKKQQKKAQRLKAQEEERETEKNKWIDFNTKAFSKTNKGRVKKSIFATPDTVGGRVGVGTCGVSGRPMTGYKHQEKWKK